MRNEIKNCRRDWINVEANKQHCRYLCNDGICENMYCVWYIPKYKFMTKKG